MKAVATPERLHPLHSGDDLQNIGHIIAADATGSVKKRSNLAANNCCLRSITLIHFALEIGKSLIAISYQRFSFGRHNHAGDPQAF